jgi:hypothetical protein
MDSKNWLNLRDISLEEFEAHSRPNDCWICINNSIYDVTNFKHPGGKVCLVRSSKYDATDAFYNANHSQAAQDLMESYLIGQLIIDEEDQEHDEETKAEIGDDAEGGEKYEEGEDEEEDEIEEEKGEVVGLNRERKGKKSSTREKNRNENRQSAQTGDWSIDVGERKGSGNQIPNQSTSDNMIARNPNTSYFLFTRRFILFIFCVLIAGSFFLYFVYPTLQQLNNTR